MKKKRNLIRRALGASVLAACAMTLPASALAATTSTSSCVAPTVSQPFLAWGDTNSYFLAAGQTVGHFSGQGWTLSGGASIVVTTMADGTTGTALDLPAGSSAVSPQLCVTSDDPDARTMIRNLSGSNGGKVGFSVSYAGTSTATAPQQTGTFNTTGSGGVGASWLLSETAALTPSSVSGWQMMQITLAPSGPKKSDFQLSNLYLDPRMHD
jgi:hypothetical protein